METKKKNKLVLFHTNICAFFLFALKYKSMTGVQRYVRAYSIVIVDTPSFTYIHIYTTIKNNY